MIKIKSNVSPFRNKKVMGIFIRELAPFQKKFFTFIILVEE